MKHFSHLNTAAEIIRGYTGQEPFHLYIKNFFRQHKKYGSKDRKQVTHLCYCFFRLGKFSKQLSLPDALITALFLCADQPNELLAAVKPEWNEQAVAKLADKCKLLQTDPQQLTIFPFNEALSDGIDANEFQLSHLVQPSVFIRTRPGRHAAVIATLTEAGIAYDLVHADCISVAAATKVDELLNINKDVVIQDYNSQRTGDLLPLTGLNSHGRAWDCCAASGGKSIMLKDRLGNISLTVSDIRPAILHNLRQRFTEAGINNYTLQAIDLSKPVSGIPKNHFDLIIADAPCSGSGTWGRTPERLTFFEQQEIATYSQLQKKITTNVLPFLRSGGYFLYITCSVFKKENEDVVHYVMANAGIELIKMETLKGYDKKADSMFAALFRKNDQ